MAYQNKKLRKNTKNTRKRNEVDIITVLIFLKICIRGFYISPSFNVDIPIAVAPSRYDLDRFSWAGAKLFMFATPRYPKQHT